MMENCAIWVIISPTPDFHLFPSLKSFSWKTFDEDIERAVPQNIL